MTERNYHSGPPKRNCSVEGCGRRHNSNGYCVTHTMQLRRVGSISPIFESREAKRLADFASRWLLNPETGCHIWQGHLNKDGYGHFGRNRRAHVAALEFAGRPRPEGLVADHLCRNRACVNPEHLEWVTIRENNMRGISPSALNAAKTHCKNGHEFTPENTDTQGGRRTCRTCMRAVQAAYRARKRARKEAA